MAAGSSDRGALVRRVTPPAHVDLERDAVIAGVVHAGDAPVSGAYVRLLDSDGEFTAEVVTSATGQFRLFAAPGTWTLRALSRWGDGHATVAVGVGVNEVALAVGGRPSR